MLKKKNLPSISKALRSGDPLPSLLAIGAALSSEREIGRLLQLILHHAINITSAEGASICLIERRKVGEAKDGTPTYQKVLRFQQSHNITRLNSYSEKVVPLNENSLIGYVATTGQFLSIRDCYALTPELPFHFNAAFDRENFYRTKSALVIPIITSNEKILGVLQLVNKIRPKDRLRLRVGSAIEEKSIIAFSNSDLELMKVFANQAAAALDNAQMAQDITNLFKSFVQASVTAIESRDPTTSGHSARVAVLTVGLARKISESSSGPFRSISFSESEIQEIRIASLLHDFGKICVKESILLKGNKLHDHEIENVKARLQALESVREAAAWKAAFNEVLENPSSYSSKNALLEIRLKCEKKIADFQCQFHKLKEFILAANEPQVISKDLDIRMIIRLIHEISHELGAAVLTTKEMERLSVSKGSLSAEERKQMEDHVVESFRFLSRIAWPEQLERVPHIAHGHHEKLDGSGYPLGLKGEEISIPARMMAIADIYDSLIASDRPYKKALSFDRTLEILNMEAREGKIDGEILKVFIEEGIYRLTLSPPELEQLKKSS